MDIQDFIVNRDQHMRPLEYDLSENFNELVRYLNDVGVLDNIPVGVTSESEIVSISDAYPAPPRALNVYGKSTQTGTPTPDAPVPILSVDELALVLAGKNLLDVFNDPENPRKNTSAAGNGNRPFEYDSAEDTYFTTNFSIVPLVIPADGTYTMTMTAKKSATTGNYFYHLNGYVSSNVLTNAYAQYSKTFTATAGQTLTLTIYNTAYVKNIQLEIGSTATAYEPYQGTTVPDMLPDGTLRSLSDGTKDELHLAYLKPSEREGWAWYSRGVTAYVGLTVLDGTLPIDLANWRASETSVGFGYSRVNFPTADSTQIMSDKLQTATYDILYNKSVDNGIALTSFSWSNTYSVFLRVAHPELTTAALVNAWLAENPITVQYPLATPVTTTLDPIELPTLPAPNATVWCDGGSATPTIVLEYVRDTNVAIAELGEAIADIVSG